MGKRPVKTLDEAIDESVNLSALQDLLEGKPRTKQEPLLAYYIEAASDEEFEKLMTLIVWARDPNLIHLK